MKKKKSVGQTLSVKIFRLAEIFCMSYHIFAPFSSGKLRGNPSYLLFDKIVDMSCFITFAFLNNNYSWSCAESFLTFTFSMMQIAAFPPKYRLGSFWIFFMSDYGMVTITKCFNDLVNDLEEIYHIFVWKATYLFHPTKILIFNPWVTKLSGTGRG